MKRSAIFLVAASSLILTSCGIGQKAQQSVPQEASDAVVDTIDTTSVPQIIIDEPQQQQPQPTTNVVKPRRPGNMY